MIVEDEPMTAGGLSLMITRNLSGPVCSNIYSEVLFDSAPLVVDAQTRRRIEETYQAAVFPLRGRHYNECLFAVVFPDDRPADIASVYLRLNLESHRASMRNCRLIFYKNAELSYRYLL